MKYEITLTQKELYVFEDIEAENEQEAIDKVLDIFDSCDKNLYHYDSDTDIECSEV